MKTNHRADVQLDALGDPTRRAIFEALTRKAQAVGELAEALPVSRPAVSQHLKVLKEAGLDMDNVVKTTVYLKNMADFAVMNEVYARYFAPEGVVPPARSTVEVARLPKDALVEIEAIATQP